MRVNGEKKGNDIRLVSFGGFYWNAVVIHGVTYLLRKLGKFGECVRP
jgi:hypothetical protein